MQRQRTEKSELNELGHKKGNLIVHIEQTFEFKHPKTLHHILKEKKNQGNSQRTKEKK